jgi:solute carrier family 45, member 1/2/4
MPDSDHHSDADENSPLVMSPVKPSVEFERQAALAETDADALAQARRNELAEQESKSTWYLVLLTLSIGG